MHSYIKCDNIKKVSNMTEDGIMQREYVEIAENTLKEWFSKKVDFFVIEVINYILLKKRTPTIYTINAINNS